MTSHKGTNVVDVLPDERFKWRHVPLKVRKDPSCWGLAQAHWMSRVHVDRARGPSPSESTTTLVRRNSLVGDPGPSSLCLSFVKPEKQLRRTHRTPWPQSLCSGTPAAPGPVPVPVLETIHMHEEEPPSLVTLFRPSSPFQLH